MIINENYENLLKSSVSNDFHDIASPSCRARGLQGTRMRRLMSKRIPTVFLDASGPAQETEGTHTATLILGNR